MGAPEASSLADVIAGQFRAHTITAVGRRLVVGAVARDMAVLGIETKLWLDGGGVNAVFMQAVADRLCKRHVARRAFMFEVEFHLHV